MSTAIRSRVLLAVAPPLLGELLARRLARDDREVVVTAQPWVDEQEHEGGRFDVILTDRLVPPGLHAVAVLCLPRPSQAGSGWLRTADGLQRVPADHVAEIVQLVDQLCRSEAPLRVAE
jgi:hypothetical protein